MKLYRAIPEDKFTEQKVYKRQATKRVPSNVPYLVDNIWEYLRPEKYPSRRHSVYASPTPELALENASMITDGAFVVTEVKFSNRNYKIAHIQVADARYHRDIKLIMSCVMEHFGKDFTSKSIMEKQKHAELFLPVVSKEELHQYFNRNAVNKELENNLKGVSSFWGQASLEPDEHDGELFFEIMDNCEYKLIKINK